MTPVLPNVSCCKTELALKRRGLEDLFIYVAIWLICIHIARLRQMPEVKSVCCMLNVNLEEI